MKIKRKELKKVVKLKTACLKARLRDALETSEAHRLRGNEIWKEKEAFKSDLEKCREVRLALERQLVVDEAQLKIRDASISKMETEIGALKEQIANLKAQLDCTPLPDLH